VSSSLGLIMILSMMLSLLYSLLMYSSFTALSCLQTAFQSYSITVANDSCAICWTSPSLNVTFLAVTLFALNLFYGI
jgi:hypothetical protein